MKGFFIGCTAAALLLAAAGWAAAEEGKADLIWIVDSSVSAGRGEGAGNARGFVAGMTALMAHRLSRVTVLRYGGWAETERAGPVVFPPSEVPSHAPERPAFVANLESVLQQSLRFEFSASDLNAPFTVKGGVFELVKSWKEEGRDDPVLVVLLSGGRFQAVETLVAEDGQLLVAARTDYREGALKNTGDANRDSVNAEAVRLFRESVIPGLSNLAHVKVLAICTTRAPRPADDPLAELARPASPIELATAGIEGVLTAFRDALPESQPVRDALNFYSLESAGAHPGEEVTREVAVVQGTTGLTLVVFGPPGFEVSLTAPDGSTPKHGKNLWNFGKDGRIRVSLLDLPLPGIYAVKSIIPDGEGQISFGVAAFRRLGYRLSMELPVRKEPRFSGEILPVQIRVTWGDPPSLVTDSATLAGMEVEITVTGPLVRPETMKMGFGRMDESRTEVPVQLGSGEWDGKVEVGAVFRAFPRGDGGFEFVSSPVRLVVDVMRGTSTIQLSFEVGRAFTHQEVGVEGKLLHGRPPEGPIEVRLEPEGEGEALAFTLFGAEIPGRLRGTVRSSKAGAWKIVKREGSMKVPALVPGGVAMLEVEPRSVALEIKENGVFKEAAEAAVPFFIAPREGEEQGAIFFVRADLAPAEEGRIRLESRDAKGWKVKVLSGGAEIPAEGIEVTGDNARVEVRVILEPEGEPPEAGVYGVGAIVPVLVLPGREEGEAPLEVTAETPLKVDVRPEPPPWYMNPLLWIAAGALLLLIFILVYLFTGPKFEFQNLVLQGEEGLGKAPLYFIDNAFGFKKQKALGTEELEEAMKVRVKSGGRCFISAVARDVEIRVNGRKVAGAFALSSGNLVEVQRGDRVFAYKYQDRPTAPEDLGDDEFVIMEFDEDDDFILADDDEIPEFETASGGGSGFEPAGPVSEAAPHGWVEDGEPESAGEGAEEPTPPAGEEAAFDDAVTLEPSPRPDGEGEPEATQGEGTLEEIAPEPEAELDDLVTSKPPAHLITADPLEITDELKDQFAAGADQPGIEPEVDEGMTLMGITSAGEVTHKDVEGALDSGGPASAGGESPDAGTPEGSGAPDFGDEETILGPLSGEEDEGKKEKEEEEDDDEGNG